MENTKKNTTADIHNQTAVLLQQLMENTKKNTDLITAVDQNLLNHIGVPTCVLPLLNTSGNKCMISTGGTRLTKDGGKIACRSRGMLLPCPTNSSMLDDVTRFARENGIIGPVWLASEMQTQPKEGQAGTWVCPDHTGTPDVTEFYKKQQSRYLNLDGYEGDFGESCMVTNTELGGFLGDILCNPENAYIICSSSV